MKRLKEIIRIVLSAILGLCIILIAYCIQFKWNFFGATLVTMREIIVLWITAISGAWLSSIYFWVYLKRF